MLARGSLADQLYTGGLAAGEKIGSVILVDGYHLSIGTVLLISLFSPLLAPDSVYSRNVLTVEDSMACNRSGLWL